MSNLESDITKMLHGIQYSEVETELGWWKTSVGARFGAKKLNELLKYFTTRTCENCKYSYKHYKPVLKDNAICDKIADDFFIHNPKTFGCNNFERKEP